MRREIKIGMIEIRSMRKKFEFVDEKKNISMINQIEHMISIQLRIVFEKTD